MTTSSEMELKAAEWLIRLETPFDASTWASFQQWLAEDPGHRKIYTELARAWACTARLKEQRDLRTQMIPELLSEQPHLREEIERRHRLVDEPAIEYDSTLVAPQPSSAPLRCILQSLAAADIKFSIHTGYLKSASAVPGLSPSLPVSTRKARRSRS